MRERLQFINSHPSHVAGLGLLASLLIAPAVPASKTSEVGPPPAEASVLLILGAAGNDEYARMFAAWADRWEQAASLGNADFTVIGRGAAQTPDRELLRAAIDKELDGSQRPLWIVMIGHGTFDGRGAKFNLRGPDVTAEELAQWLAERPRPLAFINCASASAPFIDRLAGADRVIITATKSGGEANLARFGDYLSRAITDSSADLDKDGQVSLLEAFLTASRQTQAYYDGQRQLTTEHALLDDNGDARGVRAEFFTGIRPTQTAEGGESLDGRRAAQWHLVPSVEERRLPPEMRRRRNDLELQIAQLRDQKPNLPDDEYYARLEPLLVEIARLYESAEDNVEPAASAP